MKVAPLYLFSLIVAPLWLASAAPPSDPDPAAVEATKKAFEAGKSAFLAVRPGDAQSLERARAALRDVFGAAGSGTNLEAVHALLKDGTIDSDASRLLAEVRNGMVDEVMRIMTLEHGEVHAANFSPATNLLNDIDQTFRPVAAGEDRPAGPGGEALKAHFNRAFEKRFGIAPERMDVVSHAAEATIVDWGQASEVHRFVADLRKGSNLLSSNPEAYFLEGAFRMQVERRSFESDQRLYSIYTLDPRLEGSVARTDTVLRKEGTIRELAYKNSPPEARKSYSLGSTVGNFWFMNQHGGGTRYAAKYGLRSFSEGPGWLTLWDIDPDLERHTPREFEKIESDSERRAFFDDVYDRHYRQSDLSQDEAWRTLETARHARNLGDRYQQEVVFAERARELVHGDEGLYQLQRQSLLDAAEREFRQSMTRMMMHNIEVSLPERLSDWLDPVVDPRRLDVTPEDIFERSPKYLEEHAKAKKKLRTAALFESMHALRTLDPELRTRVIERSIETLKRRKGVAAGERYPFERSLRALSKLAGAEAKPRLLMTDQERRLSGRVSFEGSRLVVQIDPEHAGNFRTPELERQVGTVTSELETALRGDGLFGPSLSNASPGLLDVRERWRVGVDRAVAGLSDHGRTFTSLQGLKDGHLALRRTLWQSLGYRAQADFEGVRAAGADPIAGMEFDLAGHLLDWGTADTALGFIKAYRSAKGNTELAKEKVREAMLLEMVKRLPYANEAMTVKGVLDGDLGSMVGAGIMAAEFMYPGVGQVAVVYSVVSGTWAILHEEGIAAWVQNEYQGRVPSDDGSAGPGVSRNPIWADTPGVLEPLLGFIAQRRADLLARRSDARADEQVEIDKLLATRYPAAPRLAHARAAVFEYFDAQLSASLENSGRPRAEWDRIKLGSYGGTIRSNDPKHLLDPANLPPLLRAFFRPLVRDYFAGTGPFADLPAHRAAHAHPLHRELYFPGPGLALERAVEDLVDVLTVGYGRALLTPANRRFQVDREWNSGAAVGASAYLFGLSAERFAGEERRFPDAGPAPALPALLDVLGGGDEDRLRDAFFPFFDGKLDALLARRLARYGLPKREDWTAYKLGRHHADLRPVAPENAGGEHPLLRAFFTRRVTEYWKKTAAAEPDLGELILDDPSLDSVGASPTTGAPFDPFQLEHRMENELSEADKRLIIDGVVQKLILDYKVGYMAELAERRRRNQEAETRTLLPAARALQDVGGAVWGDALDDASRPGANLIAAHAFVPSFLPDEGTRVWIEETAEAVHGFDDVTIELNGVPEGELSVGASLALSVEISAPKQGFERPYRVEWQVAGASSAQGEAANEHVATALLGDAESGLSRKELEITALVTDATGRDMGSQRVTIPLSSEEEEDVEDPAVAGGGGNTGESPEPEFDPEEIEYVAYIVRVSGGGWDPHYAAGSYRFDGYHDEIMWVKRGDDPQAKIDAWRERLIGDPCKKETSGFPGRGKFPLFWRPTPTLKGIAGPFFDTEKLYEHELENTWTQTADDGPHMGELREMFGCK